MVRPSADVIDLWRACPTASVPPETAMTSALPNFWLNKFMHAGPQSVLAADAAGTASHIPPPATAATASTAAHRPGALAAFLPVHAHSQSPPFTRAPAPDWYLVMPAARSRLRADTATRPRTARSHRALQAKHVTIPSDISWTSD